MYYGVCNHACCALRTKNAQERTQKSASTECVCTLARLELSFRRKRSASLYSYCHATANPLRFCSLWTRADLGPGKRLKYRVK